MSFRPWAKRMGRNPSSRHFERMWEIHIFFVPLHWKGVAESRGISIDFSSLCGIKVRNPHPFCSPSSERGSCSLGGAPRFIGVKGYVAPPHFGSPSPMGRNIYSTYLILSEKINKTNLQKKILKLVLTFYTKSIYSKYTNSYLYIFWQVSPAELSIAALAHYR